MKTSGGVGYVLLISSLAFSHSPILALLALPVFILSVILCTLFLLSLRGAQVSTKRRWLGGILILIGVIPFSVTLVYALGWAGDYFAVSAGSRYMLPDFTDVIANFTVGVVAASMIVFGIKQRSGWGKRKPYVDFLVILSTVPSAIVLMKLLVILGLPLTA